MIGGYNSQNLFFGGAVTQHQGPVITITVERTGRPGLRRPSGQAPGDSVERGADRSTGRISAEIRKSASMNGPAGVSHGGSCDLAGRRRGTLQPQKLEGHRRIAEHSAMTISTAASGPARARGPSCDGQRAVTKSSLSTESAGGKWRVDDI